MVTVLLETKDLRKTFFSLRALDGVDMHVQAGEMLGIMGPNGSGKSTLLNCLTGVLKPSGGQVFFRGKDITGWQASSVYKLGVARTFQIVQLFPEMTVLDNMLGAIQESEGSMAARLFRFSEDKDRLRAFELLDFLKISYLKDEYPKNLSYGQQKLLDLGMALMPNPSVMLLDEPLAGVNPTLGKEIVGLLLELINTKSYTMVVVEHNTKIMLDICHRLL